MPFIRRATTVSLLSLALAPLSARSAGEKLSFNRDVQPILAEYCYHCHGPDAGTRKPSNDPLRLDIEEFALAVREGGPQAIIPGNGAGSEVVKRMRSKDPQEVMPPPEIPHVMNEAQIAIIERWIDEGATYEPHWAFVKPERPAPPQVEEPWGANPVDAFLHAEMSRHRLAPNPPEDPARLFRRLTLDLTGLPPTPAGVRAFVEDTSPDAYERALDRMFDTPAHAEQMARHWLDAARYADTHGIHIDNYRAIWPYRDWVVAAFKNNMPFDRFSIEQLAGDMLPDATLEQKIATGFNRCLPTTGEGGAINEEYEAIYQMDRVETTAGVWMGLTMACAACHDHKFDPVTAEDYFAFAAFFRNTTMHPMDRNKADHPPNIFAPLPDDRPRLSEIDGLIRDIDQQLAARTEAAGPDIEAWLDGLGGGGGLEVPAEGLALTFMDGKSPVKLPGGAGIVVDGAEQATAVDGSKPFGFGLMVKLDGAPTGVLAARLDPANGQRGWDLRVENGHLAAHFIHAWPDKALKAVSKEPLKPGVWTHVWVNYNPGKRPVDRATIFVDGKPAAIDVKNRTIAGSIATDVPLRLGACGPNTPDPQAVPAGVAEVRAFRFYQRAPNAAEIGVLALHDGVVGNRGDLAREYYLANLDEPGKALRTSREALQKEAEAIRQRGSVTLVMQEKPNSEPATHFLERGDYQSPTHLVKANTPASLPPLPEGARADRLAMAKWLFDTDHPLTARVAVNRMWAQVFGEGLVATTGDFGLMGERPSHPELLDWLAVEFVESGWDQRHIFRLLFTSQAYRQSGAWTDEKAERDAENRLLTRGPRLRLDAEVLRDMALAAAGLLVDRVGGPPVKPYQPEGVWEAVAMKESNTRHYKQDQGDALYRRSLYTFWKRTAPHPAMEIFDAPSREVFCTRRERTNTPLQALVLMNDPQFVEACRVLAETALARHTTASARLEEIMMRLLARGPTPAEIDILARSYADFLGVFRDDPEAAKLLLEVGAAPRNPELDPAETAAWTLVASQILNTDECVTR